MELEEAIFCHPNSSIDRVLSRIGFGRYQLLVLCLCGSFLMAEGAELLIVTLMSSVLQKEWNLSLEVVEFMGGVLFLGTAIGTLIAGPLGDAFGRRKCMIYSSILYSIFAVVSAFMPDIWAFICTRFFLSVSIGVLVPIGTTLIVETGVENSRGLIVLAGQLLYQVGTMMVGLLGLALVPKLEPLYWRELLLIAAWPAFFSTILLIFLLDESPRWLSMNEKHDKCVKVLNKIARINNARRLAREEIEAIELIEKTEVENHLDRLGMIFGGDYLRITLQGFFLWWSIGFLYYGCVFILPRTLGGESDGDVLTDLAVMSVAQSPLSLIPMFLIEQDKFDRKNLIVIVCAFHLATSLLCSFNFNNSFYYVCISGLQICGMVNSDVIVPYTNELYSTTVRTTGYSLCFTFMNVAAILSPFILLTLHHMNPMYPYYAFSCVAGLNLINGIFLKKESNLGSLDTFIVSVN
ncbi:unnamed protein product [Blepharisma stoltei]|uniref:Major facilitator superfamily (MFS) profile domain-containing protein n=1 Tax=Blepharisma stoltei TaxID=1481888 RepID=A0AAU9IJF6_9CILI|nr:unnamed protein product [Blepharisma stoltei]